MGLLSFFSKLFRAKRKWNETLEMFLAMVMFMQSKNNPVYSKHEVLQWGEVLQKVIMVNLSPYKDFRDLLERGTPDYSVIEKLEDKMSEIQQRIELKRAIYGENADLGDDDIMTSGSESAVSARKFVKDLSKHIQFSEDEQRKIDDI
ncbi:MAG: hypothetical protein ACTHXT_12005 [Sphingobacterium sp.]